MKIGIIGGSGLEKAANLRVLERKQVSTPYGEPSSSLTCGEWCGRQVVLILRHGSQHTISPSNVNYRANIAAMQQEGVTCIIATSAAGSLREEIEPGDFVIPSQFVDRTTKRASTFYDKDQVCHISMADPFCPKLSEILANSAASRGVKWHVEKTVITIEGPRFSTRAESHLYRQWGCDVINMTTVPEAVLAREAEMCYALVVTCTDYDSFLKERFVTWDDIVAAMKVSVEKLIGVIEKALPQVDDWDCPTCRDLARGLV